MGSVELSVHGVIELRITYSSSQGKVMEMECKLLTSNFKDSKTIGLMKENIGRISDGSSSHCAGSLKLGFKMAFELKKQASELKKQTLKLEKQALELEKQALELEKRKRQPPCELLRCTRNGCTRNTTPVAYSVAGANVYCTNCQYIYGNYYMECAGCSYNRTSRSDVSCRGCGKKFL